MSRAFQAALPLARHRIDRDHATRSDAAALDALWAAPEARVLLLHRGQALALQGADPAGWDGFGAAPERAADAERPAPAFAHPASLPEAVRAAAPGPGGTGIRLYLGRALEAAGPLAAGAPVFALALADEHAELVAAAVAAVDLTASPDAAGDADAQAAEPDERTERAAADRAPEARWLNLRLVAPELGEAEAGAFTEALAVLNWHATHTHCPRCGAATLVESGGWVRRCPVEDVELFPRTDAAVIVGIVDHEDRLLLGSNALWENNRFSLLAGFVEPGESLEDAAIREIAEESGVVIDDPQYLGSQPWPFPASLMVGFLARVAEGHSGELRPDGEEILELRWFTRAQLGDPRREVLLPGSSSIARAIIETWYGGPVPEPAPPAAL